MRDIIFRGKRTDNGEWVVGYFVNAVYGASKPVIVRDSNYTDDGRVEIDDYEFVLPETVGQYTGLTDKNGKKIFEGDIVKYGDTIHQVVFEQRNGTAYYGLVYSSIETLPFGHYQDLKQIEVIGNICDNPELLKGE